MRKFTINEFIEDFENNSDQFYGFYDWFCSEKSLKNRAKAMVPKLKFLVKEGLIDGDKNYVWFKNNCPVYGSLYDDMRFSTLDDDERFIGGIAPRLGYENTDHKCSVWGFNSVGLKELHFDDWSTFKSEVKTNPELKAKLTKLWAVK